VDWFVRGITSQPNGENGLLNVSAQALGWPMPSFVFCQQPSVWAVVE
jgi:hypothetical protein